MDEFSDPKAIGEAKVNLRTNPPIPVGSNPKTGEGPRSVKELMREDIAEAEPRPTNPEVLGPILQQQIGEMLTFDAKHFTAYLRGFAAMIYEWNEFQGFWESQNTGEKIALMHSELSEALEADRKHLPSDKIPGFSGMEEELADLIIRVLDFSGRHKLRLGEAIDAKLRFNLDRPRKHGKGY